MGAFDRTAWHPGACAALEYELRDYRGALTFEPEHQLGNEPMRIDLLIIKKVPELVIENEIGALFRTHNLIEYKSPRDSLSIDDFYKVKGYACFYKATAGKTDAVKEDDISISLIREHKPKALFERLKRKHTIEMVYPGVYYVSDPDFACQIIVTAELTSEHPVLRILSERASDADARRVLSGASGMDEIDRRNIDAVLQVSVAVNSILYEQIKEDSDMCQALRELMADEIAMDLEKGRAEGSIGAFIQSVKAVISSLHISADAAIQMLCVPEQYRSAVLAGL